MPGCSAYPCTPKSSLVGATLEGGVTSPVSEPNAVDEISSLGVGGGNDARPEGRVSCLDHGDRARTGREQPHHELPTLVG